jgi:hypothetical protein
MVKTRQNQDIFVAKMAKNNTNYRGQTMPFMFLKKKVFKKVLKSFRRVLKSKNSLKS